MPPPESTIAPDPWRRGLQAVTLLVLGLVLVACGGGGGLSSSTQPNPKGKTPPPVLLQQLTGIPPDKAKPFKDALALAAGQHDIGIVEGAAGPGAYSLSGTFRGTEPGGTATITYSFELRDADGVLVQNFPGVEQVGPVSNPDPWSAVTSTNLQHIAGAASSALAQKLSELGYATRVGSLLSPPSYLFASAGPGAQYDIDLETLNGPSAIEPVATPPLTVTPELAVAPPVEVPPEPPPSANGDINIRVVAVVPVEGAPGSGNRELTDAMRRTLRGAGWPVVDAPRSDALTIRGKVELADAEGGSQKVALHWLVETPKGAPLGDVKQANSVPAGSLDQSWGPAATAVAEAAAGGIFDVIKKYR